MAGKPKCLIFSRVLNSKQSRRAFQDKNFVEALRLTIKFRVLADEEDHPPLIVVERGKVTVQ